LHLVDFFLHYTLTIIGRDKNLTVTFRLFSRGLTGCDTIPIVYVDRRQEQSTTKNTPLVTAI